MYLITKHITRFNGFHSDIPVGVCSTMEDAKKCIETLNASSNDSVHSNPDEVEQFIYRKIDVLDI